MGLPDIEKCRDHMVEIKLRVALINQSLATRPQQEFYSLSMVTMIRTFLSRGGGPSKVSVLLSLS